MSKNRCALLDTDFISKLYATKIDDSDRFIQRIICIDTFHFVCHFQTIKEINNYDSSIANWMCESDSIHVYTDRDLLSFLIDDFGQMAYMYFLDILKKSCNTFSSRYYEEHYSALNEYQIDFWSKWNIDDFLSILEECDEDVGQDNNLGEIKLYTTAQILEVLSIEELYIFCSDDRKARSVMSNQNNIDCVSALASFYLAKKYLKMSKENAQVFFDSWMVLYRKQKCFQIYSESGYQLERVLGQDIFDMLYEDKLDLQKDGFFKRK